jgi:hypothetical protein
LMTTPSDPSGACWQRPISIKLHLRPHAIETKTEECSVLTTVLSRPGGRRDSGRSE